MRKFLFLILPFVMGVNISFAADLFPGEQALPTKLRQQIPQGWNAIDYSFGDLNNDGIIDYGMVIQQSEPSEHLIQRILFTDKPPYVNRNELYEFKSKHKRRVWIVFFVQPDGSYKLAMANPHWVDRIDMARSRKEPLERMIIYKGNVSISSYFSTRLEVKFDSQKTKADGKIAWQVIKYNNRYIDPTTGDRTYIDRDYINYKVDIRKYSVSKEMIHTKISEEMHEIEDKTKIYISSGLN